jgi:hypothetical protein
VIGSDQESVHASGSPAFADAVTFAFADARADAYGFARLALSPPHDETARHGTAVAALLSRGGLVASAVAADVPVPAASGWEAFALAGVATTTPGPLEWWSAAFVEERSNAGMELVFQSDGPPAGLRSGGLDGYAQACRVQGTATIAGAARTLGCRGQRDHTWGEVDWGRVERVESCGVWLDDGTGLSLRAIRSAAGDDATWAAALGPSPREASDGASIAAPSSGRIDVDVPSAGVRAEGETICGCALDVGAVRMELAFLTWTVDGRAAGVGCYEALRLG